MAKHDVESAAMDSEELRRKKRMKCFGYVAAFVLFQTAVILVFALVVMKVRTPEFEVRTAAVEAFDLVGASPNPAFNIRLHSRIRVKNTNFGPYKYQNSTVFFYYRGTLVGEASSPRGKAGFRSSKSFNVVANLSSSNVTNVAELGRDLSSGRIRIEARSRLEGRAEMMWFMFKKKRATEMECTLDIGSDRTIREIEC